MKKEITPHPILNKSKGLQAGMICAIVADNTDHYYPNGTIVILTHSHEAPYRYAVTTNNVNRYVSRECVNILDQVMDTGVSSHLAFSKSLILWLKNHSYELNIPKRYPLWEACPRTQKGRGIRTLLSLGLLGSGNTYLYQEPIAHDGTPTLPSFPTMARPCPRIPRHGFVESRVVKDQNELNSVIKETLHHDPHGEVLCMPHYSEAYSGIVTDSTLSIGKGTNGATAGTSSMSVPCHSNLMGSLNFDQSSTITAYNRLNYSVEVNMVRYAGLHKHKAIFVETVGNKVVQLRTGPKADFSLYNYSPNPIVKVQAIYEISGKEEFDTFETQLNEYQGVFGTQFVVYFPTGSLVSHYAVQAIAKKIPVITRGKAPVIGQVYIFTTHELLRTTSTVRTAIRHSIREAEKLDINSESLEFAVATIQGIGPAPKVSNSAALLAGAGLILAKAGAGICLGEYRHFFRNGPGKYGHQPLGPYGIPLELDLKPNPTFLERTSIYQEVFTMPWDNIKTYYKLLGWLMAAKHDFTHKPWRGAFGGPAWANCTEATIQVLLHMIPFLAITRYRPGLITVPNTHLDESFNRLIGACNKLITVSHNSSLCLTKIIHPSKLMRISCGDTGLTLARSPLTMRFLKP